MFTEYSPYILIMVIMPACGIIAFLLLAFFTKLPQEKRVGLAGAAFTIPGSIYFLIGFHEVWGLSIVTVLMFALLPIFMYFAGTYYWKVSSAQNLERARLYREKKEAKKQRD